MACATLQSQIRQPEAAISFRQEVAKWLIFEEAVPDDPVIRIIPESIPSVEKRILCAVFLEAVLRFYEQPENEAAFRKWILEKGGAINGP